MGFGAGTLLSAVAYELVPKASFEHGVGLALGDAVSLAFVTAVFVSNIPQGIAGTIALREAGYTDRHVFWMWTALTVTCGVTAAVGFLVADAVPHQGLSPRRSPAARC